MRGLPLALVSAFACASVAFGGSSVRAAVHPRTAAATLPLPRTRFVELSMIVDPNVRAEMSRTCSARVG